VVQEFPVKRNVYPSKLEPTVLKSGSPTALDRRWNMRLGGGTKLTRSWTHESQLPLRELAVGSLGGSGRGLNGTKSSKKSWPVTRGSQCVFDGEGVVAHGEGEDEIETRFGRNQPGNPTLGESSARLYDREKRSPHDKNKSKPTKRRCLIETAVNAKRVKIVKNDRPHRSVPRKTKNCQA